MVAQSGKGIKLMKNPTLIFSRRRASKTRALERFARRNRGSISIGVRPVVLAADGLVFVRIPRLDAGANLTVDAAEMLVRLLNHQIEEAKKQERFQQAMSAKPTTTEEE
jgi:hypothetical protein